MTEDDNASIDDLDVMDRLAASPSMMSEPHDELQFDDDGCD
jgi:hypothetical protein